MVIHLPDFDERVADRRSGGAEDAPAEVCNFSDGRCQSVIDNDKVIIGVEREIDGVERPFGLTRGLRELLGEGSWKPQPGGTKGEVAYEAAAGWVLVIHVRRLQFTDS